MERRRYIPPTYPVMSKTETTPKRHSESTHYTKELSSSTKVNRLREEEQEKCQENQSSLQCCIEKKKQDELAESHAVSHNLKLKRPRSLINEFSFLQSNPISTLESNNTLVTLSKQHIPEVSTTQTHRVTSRWKLPMPDLVNKHHINNSITDNTNLVSKANNAINSVNLFDTTCTPSLELEANKVNKIAEADSEKHNVNVISEHAILSAVDNTSRNTNNINTHSEEDDSNNNNINNVSDNDNIKKISSNSINHHNCIETYCDDSNICFISLPRKENVMATSVVQHKCKEKYELANAQHIATREQERVSESAHYIDKFAQHKTDLCKDDKKAIEIAEHILLEHLRTFTNDTYDKREAMEPHENKEFCEEEVKPTHSVKEWQADYVRTEVHNNTDVFNDNIQAGDNTKIIYNCDDNSDSLDNKHDRRVEPFISEHMSNLNATQINDKTMPVATLENGSVNLEKEDNLLAHNVSDFVEQYKLIKRTLCKLKRNKEELCSKDISAKDNRQSYLADSEGNNDRDEQLENSITIDDEKCNSETTNNYSRDHRNNGFECKYDKVSSNDVSSDANLLQFLEVCKTQETLLLEEQRLYIANMELCERNATQSRASLSSFFDSRYDNQHEWIYRHRNDAVREKPEHME